MIRVGGIVCWAALGATTALLWWSPAAAGDQPLPGATVESVVAVARRLNPTVAAAALDFDAAVHKIGTAGVLADPTLILEAWDVNRLGVGQRRFGLEQIGQTWIACRWLIKHGHKALELSLRQTEVASIKQYDFRFPACRLQHEIGAVPAEGLRGPVYKLLLATAHPQVNGGASGFVRLRCG